MPLYGLTRVIIVKTRSAVFEKWNTDIGVRIVRHRNVSDTILVVKDGFFFGERWTSGTSNVIINDKKKIGNYRISRKHRFARTFIRSRICAKGEKLYSRPRPPRSTAVHTLVSTPDFPDRGRLSRRPDAHLFPRKDRRRRQPVVSWII